MAERAPATDRERMSCARTGITERENSTTLFWKLSKLGVGGEWLVVVQMEV